MSKIIVIAEAEIGEADSAEKAFEVLCEYATDRFGYLFDDGRSLSALITTCLDRVGLESGLNFRKGVFQSGMVRAHGRGQCEAWIWRA